MAGKWLITGGAGFVGSNLARALLAQGKEVVVFDNSSRVGAERNLSWLLQQPGAMSLKIQRGDVRDREVVTRMFMDHAGGLEGVAHLAGQVAMTTSIKDPLFDFQTNALGALHVLEAVRAFCPQTPVLFSSTNKVYGDLHGVRLQEQEKRWVAPDFPEGFDESLALSFESPYGCSKGAADQYFLDYARIFGLHTIVFRHSSLYGGRQFATFDQGWVGWFCEQALKQRESRVAGKHVEAFTISGDGKQVRDLLHADDLVECYLVAAEAARKSPKSICGQAYNIGGGQSNSLSLLELFDELAIRLGSQPVFRRLGWRQSDQRIFVANNAKARAAFGFEPRISNAAGIDRMLDWVSSAEVAG
jgi:CDP-paratose 2-epimerase